MSGKVIASEPIGGRLPAACSPPARLGAGSVADLATEHLASALVVARSIGERDALLDGVLHPHPEAAGRLRLLVLRDGGTTRWVFGTVAGWSRSLLERLRDGVPGCRILVPWCSGAWERRQVFLPIELAPMVPVGTWRRALATQARQGVQGAAAPLLLLGLGGTADEAWWIGCSQAAFPRLASHLGSGGELEPFDLRPRRRNGADAEPLLGRPVSVPEGLQLGLVDEAPGPGPSSPVGERVRRDLQRETYVGLTWEQLVPLAAAGTVEAGAARVYLPARLLPGGQVPGTVARTALHEWSAGLYLELDTAQAMRLAASVPASALQSLSCMRLGTADSEGGCGGGYLLRLPAHPEPALVDGVRELVSSSLAGVERVVSEQIFLRVPAGRSSAVHWYVQRHRRLAPAISFEILEERLRRQGDLARLVGAGCEGTPVDILVRAAPLVEDQAELRTGREPRFELVCPGAARPLMELQGSLPYQLARDKVVARTLDEGLSGWDRAAQETLDAWVRAACELRDQRARRSLERLERETQAIHEELRTRAAAVQRLGGKARQVKHRLERAIQRVDEGIGGADRALGELARGLTAGRTEALALARRARALLEDPAGAWWLPEPSGEPELSAERLERLLDETTLAASVSSRHDVQAAAREALAFVRHRRRLGRRLERHQRRVVQGLLRVIERDQPRGARGRRTAPRGKTRRGWWSMLTSTARSLRLDPWWEWPRLLRHALTLARLGSLAVRQRRRAWWLDGEAGLLEDSDDPAARRRHARF